MIRVLTFGRFADQDFGGIERYVFELAGALKGEAHFANIVARRGAPPDAEPGARTVYAGAWSYVAGAPVCPTMPLHALRLHLARPFDIVHLQFPADPMAHLSTLLLPRAVKRVITWHSDIVRQKRLLAWYRPFVERLVRSADAVIMPSPAHPPSGAPRERTHVVPFGLAYQRFMHRPLAAEGLRRRHGGRFLVFALGRHVYYKGFEHLLRAMARLPECRLVLGGRGPLTPALAALVESLGLKGRVELAGRIPDADLPAYYHACDVFCLPSSAGAEAFGLVQLEAMACGKPVVGCQLGNGAAWVNRDGHTGLLVPPADPPALAAALERLRLDPALRQRLGQQAKARALREFPAAAMARRTLEVYRAALRSNNYKPPGKATNGASRGLSGSRPSL